MSNKKIQELENRVNELKEKIDVEEKHYSRLYTDFEDLSDKYKELDDENTSLENRVDELEYVEEFEEIFNTLINSSINFKTIINQMKMSHILNNWDNIIFDLPTIQKSNENGEIEKVVLK